LRGDIGSEFPQGGSGDEMTLKIESIVDGGMHAEEALADRADLNRCTLRSRRRAT
jgi:hypothetical protein